MKDNRYLAISDFARLSRTTRDTLLHYDKVGLLSPVSRGGNKYRYYSIEQLAVVNIIRTLQDTGMTLKEIRQLYDQRSPTHTSEMLNRQFRRINNKIDALINVRELLMTLKNTIEYALTIENYEEVTFQLMPAQAIVLGEMNDYSNGRNAYNALRDFYYTMNKKYPNMNLNYSVWGVYSAERVARGDWHYPDRYFLNNPDGKDEKPAALYAIGYARGGYGQCDALYVRMLEHIERNGHEIFGNIYEEYPLNELCVADYNNYLIRLMITVRKKQTTDKSVP